MAAKTWQKLKTKKIIVSPEDKLEAVHTIVEQHSTDISPVDENETNDKVTISVEIYLL
jgi:hypothetical protein